MPGTLRITRLTFQAGSAPGREPLAIVPPTVVVLVGPNNSGKSLALREIETWCVAEDRPQRVIDTIAIDFPADFESAVLLLEPFVQESSVHRIERNGQTEDRDFVLLKPNLGPEESGVRDRVWESQIRLSITGEPENAETNLRKYFTRWHAIRLDGRTRFALTDQLPGGDLVQKPANHLHALAQDDAKREAVRAQTAAAFDRYFVLDFLNIGWVRVRMSQRAPEDPDEELALSARAQEFHRDATPIEEFGDGVRCFTGLVAAVQGLSNRILLVDEPEAFLHPPLARQLGSALARLAQDREGSLIVATHSADILLGCLESGTATAVVRLGYEAGVATARQLPAEAVQRLAQDPLLRSSNVLRALFHRGAVVCESDTDRAVYDEMNRRLLEEDRGIQDVLFLNAQGNSSIHRVVGPLRQLGVPAVAIVDLDTIGSGGQWRDLLAACGIPEARRQELDPARLRLRDAFTALPMNPDGSSPIKGPGLTALAAADQAQAQAFLNDLAMYGLFLVPVGELESWLAYVGAIGKKTAWVTRLFGRIGVSRDDANYLRPGNNDIWGFLDRIRDWIASPDRDGMN